MSALHLDGNFPTTKVGIIAKKNIHLRFSCPPKLLWILHLSWLIVRIVFAGMNLKKLKHQKAHTFSTILPLIEISMRQLAVVWNRNNWTGKLFIIHENDKRKILSMKNNLILQWFDWLEYFLITFYNKSQLKFRVEN